MRAPGELYPAVLAWLQALEVVPHPAGLASLANLVTALLVGQSLRCGALGRAQVSGRAVPARQGFQRLARAWTRLGLSSAVVTPALVRGALALRPPGGVVHLALDSVRCGAWETFTVGLVWEGRVVPLAWRTLIYRVPAEPASKRVSVWRDLKRLGALYLQQCVCIVPDLANVGYPIADRCRFSIGRL